MRQILKLLPFLTEQNGQTWKRWQETESNRYTWSRSEVDWIHDTCMLKNPHREYFSFSIKSLWNWFEQSKEK